MTTEIKLQPKEVDQITGVLNLAAIELQNLNKENRPETTDLIDWLDAVYNWLAAKRFTQILSSPKIRGETTYITLQEKNFKSVYTELIKKITQN